MKKVLTVVATVVLASAGAGVAPDRMMTSPTPAPAFSPRPATTREARGLAEPPVTPTRRAPTAGRHEEWWRAEHGEGRPGHRHFRDRDDYGLVTPRFDPFWYDYDNPEPVSPPVVVEPAPEAPADAYYWYYCPEVGVYYPYVQECPGGWLTVVPPSSG